MGVDNTAPATAEQTHQAVAPTTSPTTAPTQGTTVRNIMGAGQSASQEADANHANNLMVDRSSGSRYALLDIHVPSIVGTIIVVLIILMILGCVLKFVYSCWTGYQSRARERRMDSALGQLASRDREMKVRSVMSQPSAASQLLIPGPGPDPLAV